MFFGECFHSKAVAISITQRESQPSVSLGGRRQTQSREVRRTHTHIYTNTPGHGWLGGCSQCRGKSFAQGRGSGRWQNLSRSARRCTAPGKRRCKLGKKLSPESPPPPTRGRSPLQRAGGRMFERNFERRKSCISNCRHKAFVGN